MRRDEEDGGVTMGDEAGVSEGGGDLRVMGNSDPTVYTVEKILKKRKRHGFTEYLVKWKSYSTK